MLPALLERPQVAPAFLEVWWLLGDWHARRAAGDAELEALVAACEGRWQAGTNG